jgi:hypothetical protein
MQPGSFTRTPSASVATGSPAGDVALHRARHRIHAFHLRADHAHALRLQRQRDARARPPPPIGTSTTSGDSEGRDLQAHGALSGDHVRIVEGGQQR